MELLIKAKNGDKEALDTLVSNNIGLVWSVVKKFGNRGYEFDDLYQVGCIGLIKAIKNFDLKFDVKFSTYAVPMIMGEIKRFLRDDGIIKVSRHLKELSMKVRVATEKLEIKLNREPKISEIAEYLGISDSTYLRKQVLGNLEKQGYLESSKISRAMYFKTNPDMVTVN